MERTKAQLQREVNENPTYSLDSLAAIAIGTLVASRHSYQIRIDEATPRIKVPFQGPSRRAREENERSLVNRRDRGELVRSQSMGLASDGNQDVNERIVRGGAAQS